jgi:hypothetical protein
MHNILYFFRTELVQQTVLTVGWLVQGTVVYRRVGLLLIRSRTWLTARREDRKIRHLPAILIHSLLSEKHFEFTLHSV